MLILGLVVLVGFASLCAEAQQPMAFDDLERYLNKEMVGPEAIKVIKSHLNESGTSAPLENLVEWAKAGFPDLHDEHGIWKTESLSLKLGVVRSIHYYFSTSPPTDKSNKYLSILDELRTDDYMSFHLVGTAHWFVDEAALQTRAEQLLQDNDPKLRAEGVHLGRTVAEKNLSLLDRYKQMLKTDEDPHVRTTILYSIIGWRRKDIAYVAFDRLLHDSNADVRDWGARGLRSATDHGVLTTDDLPAILPALLKTNDPFVRLSIGHAAARLCSDRSLFIRADKFTDEFLYSFINLVRMKGTRMGSALSESELAKEWLAWWTPLIPQYTARPRLVH